jgi:hypothetical protein
MNKLERIWKREIVAYFMILQEHFPGGTEENH